MNSKKRMQNLILPKICLVCNPTRIYQLESISNINSNWNYHFPLFPTIQNTTSSIQTQIFIVNLFNTHVLYLEAAGRVACKPVSCCFDVWAGSCVRRHYVSARLYLFSSHLVFNGCYGFSFRFWGRIFADVCGLRGRRLCLRL